MSEGTRTSEAVSFLVGAAAGISVVSAIFAQPGVEEWVEESWPLPLRTGGVVASGVSIAIALVWSLRQRSRLGVAISVALVPLAVGTGAVRLLDPNPSWAQALRALGLVLVISMVLGGALWFARRLRELERLLFTEATSAAFFVTVIVAGGYGALQAFLDAPRLSYGWLPVFGLVVWALSAAMFRRRYS